MDRKEDLPKWERTIRKVSLFVIALSLMILASSFFYQPMRTYGNSMLPTFESGTILLCDKTDTDYEVGDIIVFKEGRTNSFCTRNLFQSVEDHYWSNDGCVVHRIVDIKNDTIITKGDNNYYVDEPVKLSDDRIVCKATKVLWADVK